MQFVSPGAAVQANLKDRIRTVVSPAKDAALKNLDYSDEEQQIMKRRSKLLRGEANERRG